VDAEQRLDELERRVAVLEGKPDPGLTCPGTAYRTCLRGRAYYRDHDGDEVYSVCEVCGGTGRVYPPV